MNKKDSFNSYILTFVYGFIFLLIAIFVRDIPAQPSIFSTVQDMLKPTNYGLGDPISFMKAGLDFSRYGWVSAENHWIINLWPPGFMLLEALVIKLVGESGPIILSLQIVVVALYAVVMAKFSSLIFPFVGRWMAVFLPISIFLFPMPRVFLLQPMGMVMGETLAIGFFFLGALESILALTNNCYKKAVWAGVFFALAAYFRSQFEIFIVAMSFWWVLGLFVNVISSLDYKQSLKTIALVLLFAHLTMSPWRAYHLWHDHSMKWVHTDSVTFGNSVRGDVELTKAGGGFVVEGGGNLVCRLDPSTCEQPVDAKKMFIKTFLKYPLKWLSIKAQIAPAYWFSSVENWTKVAVKPSWLDYFWNLLFLLFLVLSVVVLFLKSVRKNSLWPVFLWLNFTVHSTYFLIFTVQQFEVRYFYFYKIFGLFILIAELTVLRPKFLEKLIPRLISSYRFPSKVKS
jgi:hypothetical protein